MYCYLNKSDLSPSLHCLNLSLILQFWLVGWSSHCNCGHRHLCHMWLPGFWFASFCSFAGRRAWAAERQYSGCIFFMKWTISIKAKFTWIYIWHTRGENALYKFSFTNVFQHSYNLLLLILVGSGSLSSPMREHRNFAHFYCISVTNFSTVSECILLEIIWIKGTLSSHSYGCFYVCMQCTSKNRQLIFYGRYLPFVRCRSRGPRLERKQSMCLSARWQSDTRSTQQYVVSLDRKLNADSSGVNAVVVYKHLWSLERILVGNSQKKSILNHKTPSNV